MPASLRANGTGTEDVMRFTAKALLAAAAMGTVLLAGPGAQAGRRTGTWLHSPEEIYDYQQFQQEQAARYAWGRSPARYGGWRGPGEGEGWGPGGPGWHRHHGWYGRPQGWQGGPGGGDWQARPQWDED
jgi:hypothetical protein